MLDVVKFRWRNRYGYWPSAQWITVVSDADDATIRNRASIGRPGLTDIEIIDRAAIPEELRLTGSSGVFQANVVLYHPDASSLTAAEFVARMGQDEYQHDHRNMTKQGTR